MRPVRIRRRPRITSCSRLLRFRRRGRGDSFALGEGISLAPVDGFGFWVSARVVGVYARLPGSCVGGLSQCRVGAFGVCGLLRLANLFITISHCAWRHVISFSKAKKKRSKENAFTALP